MRMEERKKVIVKKKTGKEGTRTKKMMKMMREEMGDWAGGSQPLMDPTSY